MGIEIEFLPVGEKTKDGDAIVIRYGEEGDYTIIVIDGGHSGAGDRIVEHIKGYYQTNYVDYVINTHPDLDHVSGLITVLEELEVGELWMHLPWEHSEKIRDLFKDGRITDNSLMIKIKDSLKKAYRLYQIALEKGIPVKEPFEGESIGEFRVLSPFKDWYLRYLLPKFPNMPSLKKVEKSITEASLWNIKQGESWYHETLQENYKTTNARNESSVVLYGNIEGNEVLLTGDAGKQALHNSADYTEELGIDLKKCTFVQVPHHGSRRNVSPSVLNRIIGDIQPMGSSPTTSAFVSVSKETVQQPKKIVVNAFIRRGAKVCETRGSTIRFSRNMPSRPSWVATRPLNFETDVEE